MTQIIEPSTCPSCEHTLTKIKDQLFCTNVFCEAQVSGKILHFCSVLSIKGLGPKTIEKLNIQSIPELFYLSKDDVVAAVGEKTAVKLLDEIERSKLVSLNKVIEAMSIPLIGSTAAIKIASVIESIEDINAETCKLAGLGEKASENLIEWVTNEYKTTIKGFVPFTFTKVVQPTGKTVCITGKLKSYKKKADAEADLASKGFVLVDSVTKDTNYLVDEENGTSLKRQKAEKYGVIIITDLNDLIERKN